MMSRFEDKLRTLLIDLENTSTNGEAADIHERIGILLEERGDALADAVEAAREMQRTACGPEERDAWLALSAALRRLDGEK